MKFDDIAPEETELIAVEIDCLDRVKETLAKFKKASASKRVEDDELVALRDQLGETRAEDHAMLVEHMTRVAALRRTKQDMTTLTVDVRKPYFGHLTLKDELEGTARERRILIGKHAFIDSASGIQIVDWRNSPVSRIFYCYDETDEYEEVFGGQTNTGEVVSRRTLGIDDGQLRSIRDRNRFLGTNREGQWMKLADSRASLSGGVGTAVRVPRGAFVGRRDEHRLPEITALIDPEQFRAMTSHRSGVVVIQGGAGTGKTTIALHRVAYLHYQDPTFFSAKRTLVLTPGDALRRYVANVLPALGMQGVRVRTYTEWAMETVKRLIPSLKKRKLTSNIPLGARRLKRHPIMVKVLDAVVRQEAKALDEELRALGGPACERGWVARRNLAPIPRINAFLKWLSRAPDISTRAKDSVERFLRASRDDLADPVETWAAVLTDANLIRSHLQSAHAHFYEWEIDQLVKTVSAQLEEPGDAGSYLDHGSGIDGRSIFDGEINGLLDEDDLSILLRICQLKYGQTSGPSNQRVNYHHIVVDEAQDLAPVTVLVIADSAAPNAPVTLAGDTAQRLSLDSGFGDWDLLLETTGIRAHVLPALAISYRSTQQVMKLAREILGDLAPKLDTQDARDGAPVQHLCFDSVGEAVLFLTDALNGLRDRERSATVALIARDAEVADAYYSGLKRSEVQDLRRVRQQEFSFQPGIDITDIYQVKGLEYDYIVALEITQRHYPVADEARHLLHVLATRAAHQLWLISTDTPSGLIPESYRDV